MSKFKVANDVTTIRLSTVEMLDLSPTLEFGPVGRDQALLGPVKRLRVQASSYGDDVTA